MEDRKDIVDSFIMAMNMVENTLERARVPFIVDTLDEHQEYGPYAIISIDGEKFHVYSTDGNGVKLWIVNFPVDNHKEAGTPSGYSGFPSDVAGAIQKYYEEKPRGNVQKFSGVGDLGTINLNEMVKEEVKTIFEDFDFAAAEREYHDKNDYNESIEAEVSAGLSFMQDMQGSMNKLNGLKSLSGTGVIVDYNIKKALEHMRKATQGYLEKMSPDAKNEMTDRMGEINIDK